MMCRTQKDRAGRTRGGQTLQEKGECLAFVQRSRAMASTDGPGRIPCGGPEDGRSD